MDDTKGMGQPVRVDIANIGNKTGVTMPEEVMEQIHQQATYLGPVLEAILKESHQHGRSHWGLNE